QALTTAIATKIVTVIDHGTDIYGRMLGTIWLDGYDINASMVDSGYAWVYRFEDNAIVPGYIKYESAAQKEAKGLWADTNPVPPWQWRQANEKPRKVKEKK
ncbi:thermonuclease family protein, partial [Pseudomonas aeruginosa]